MSMDGASLIYSLHGRPVVLQRVEKTDRFQALIGMGVRESVALALLAGLVTTKGLGR